MPELCANDKQYRVEMRPQAVRAPSVYPKHAPRFLSKKAWFLSSATCFTRSAENGLIFKHLPHPMNCPAFQPIVSVMPTWVSQPK